MRKKLLSVLVLTTLVASVFVGCSDEPGSTFTILSISEGDVLVMEEGADSWEEAQVGMSLEPGYSIKTGDNSSAMITFFDGSTIELEAGTEIEINSLDIAADTSATTITLRQLIGTTISRVIELVDPASRYEIETPAGEAVVRGTVMIVSVSEDGTTEITNERGNVYAVAQGVELEVPKGQQCNIVPGQPPTVAIEFDFHTWWASVHFQADGDTDFYGYDGMGHEAWMDTIAARVLAETDGYEIRWNTYYAQNPGQIHSLVQDGSYDVGVTALTYCGGAFPLWQGPEYPGDLYRNNAYTMSLAVQELYDEFAPLQNEMAAQNLKVMHFWSTGPGYFFMTPGNNVSELADFEALTLPIRVENPASNATVAALGAEPAVMPMSSTAEAFEDGELSGMLCPGDTPKTFALDEHLQTATLAPFSYQFVFMKVMNTATWNALPAEVQTIFNEVNAVWPAYYGKLRTWGEEVDGIAYCEANIDGWSLYDLRAEDPTEYDAWVDACDHLITDWIDGDSTRQALWDKFVELDEYYATTAPYCNWTSGASPPPIPTFP